MQQSNTDDIEWLLNLTNAIPRYELLQGNMKKLAKVIQPSDKLLECKVYTFNGILEKFHQVDLLLLPNMITYQDNFLILSTCRLEKRTVSYKEHSVRGLLLANQIGNTFLFFSSYSELLQWSKQIKKFCKLRNFLQKFTLKERTNIQNIFACMHNKTGKIYSVQILRLADLEKNNYAYEQLMNEVNILMSFQHPSLLQYSSIYEDQQHLYILYEYWVGDQLYKLIDQGLKLNQIQIAGIVYQLLKVVKVLHQHDIYHGQITPANIIVLRSFSMMNGESLLRIALLNFGYREEMCASQLAKRLPKQWVPPDFTEVQPNKIDQYQIGCTLIYLATYRPTKYGLNQPFPKSIESLDISYTFVQQQRIYVEQHQLDKAALSASQIDLILNLMHPDPSQRKDVAELINHYWFINIEAKSKQQQSSRFKILPSLRTILEIREQSSLDLVSKSELQNRGQNLSIMSIDSDDIVESDSNDFLDLISDENSQLSQYVAKLNYQSVNSIKNK